MTFTGRREHRTGSSALCSLDTTSPSRAHKDPVALILREITMAERTLRGMKIGANSMESEIGVELAPRVEAVYDCPDGRVLVIPFSAEAEIPAIWEAPGGGEALLRDAVRPEPKATKPQRTHWDMLLERRSIAELEDLLNERLDLLRTGQVRKSA